MGDAEVPCILVVLIVVPAALVGEPAGQRVHWH